MFIGFRVALTLGLLALPGAAWAACGDGVCDVGSEDCNSCASDCETCCGDGVCSASAGEACGNCAEDCGACGGCGDGVCGGAETCESCAEDCGGCCGDGLCDPGAGESCVSCAADCGDCCGDGVCGGDETCEACEEDCGACAPAQLCGDGVCHIEESCATCAPDCGACEAEAVAEPDEAPPACTTSIRPDYRAPPGLTYTVASPKLHGVGASATLTAGLDVGGRGAALCERTLQGAGDVQVCASLFGETDCIAGQLRVEGACGAEPICGAGPRATCDAASACCSAELSAEARAQRTWKTTRRFGAFNCEVELGGMLSGAFTALSAEGPGCGCDEAQIGLRPEVRLDAEGQGRCRARLFGVEVEAPLSATACAVGSARGGRGCGQTIEGSGGAELEVALGRGVKIGWARLSDGRARWKTGEGCR